MSRVSPEIQELTRRLLAFEAARGNSSAARAETAARVIEELRLHLVRLAGIAGFRSLLSRALTLAKAEAPALNIVRLRADGSLEGLAEIEGSGEAEVGAAAGQAGVVLVANVLELLVTFIGEPLTLRLVHGIWPDASVDEVTSRGEEKP